ncbi:hypothetical protein GCM10022226_78810 [Sphaerisporangium flaviroseum]|uniref:Endonuclease/exonuclease/phosphatase domain-containing protein n=1 Tax=Sphaerisporangium flaviroseum TaxID=509199 RepID=A0ABP7JFS1_9ACTN
MTTNQHLEWDAKSLTPEESTALGKMPRVSAIYQCLLRDGKDALPVDREAAAEILAINPNGRRVVRATRSFRPRSAVRRQRGAYPAGCGHRSLRLNTSGFPPLRLLTRGQIHGDLYFPDHGRPFCIVSGAFRVLPRYIGWGGQMLIASWNLRDGGIDAGDTSRLERQLRLLADVRADVVLIQEAKHWLTDGARWLHLANCILGMSGYIARAERHDCNLVVFIRPRCGLVPVRERHEVHAPFWHAQARVECRVAGGDVPVVLASAHFAPFDPVIREQEARASSDLAKGLTVLGGDFNDSGLGDPPVDWESLPGYKAVRHGPDDQAAARVLHQAGYIDVAAYLADHQNDPRLRAPTAGFGHGLAPIRCDRIHVTAPMVGAIRGYRLVEQDQSDHHLITVDLDLSQLPDLATRQALS